ncbi:MAG: hypothetical protein ACYS8Z_05235 [Planctomycetota bacterium]|jgi:hypothetical protein
MKNKPNFKIGKLAATPSSSSSRLCAFAGYPISTQLNKLRVLTGLCGKTIMQNIEQSEIPISHRETQCQNRQPGLTPCNERLYKTQAVSSPEKQTQSNPIPPIIILGHLSIRISNSFRISHLGFRVSAQAPCPQLAADPEYSEPSRLTADILTMVSGGYLVYNASSSTKGASTPLHKLFTNKDLR